MLYRSKEAFAHFLKIIIKFLSSVQLNSGEFTGFKFGCFFVFFLVLIFF